MFKFKILTATSLICIAAFLVSTSVLWAFRSAQDECASRQLLVFARCTRVYGEDANADQINFCFRLSQQAYENCMRAKSQNQNKGGNYPSPTPPPNVKHPTPVGNASPPPTPVKLKPIHPISGPVTSKSPAPSPSPTPQTIFAKPKSTPTPRTVHHGGGHHG